MDSPLTNYDLIRNGGVPSHQYLMQQHAFNQTGYFQDPYMTMQATYMPPYYGMPTQATSGLPPQAQHNMLYQLQQQQQQQQLGTSPGTLTQMPPPQLLKNQPGRPQSPQQGANQQQQPGNSGSQLQDQSQMANQYGGFGPYYAATASGAGGAPYGAFDPNSAAAQLMMSSARNINQVRLVSPMLLNAGANQNNFFGKFL
jgi:hypothetical protein